MLKKLLGLFGLGLWSATILAGPVQIVAAENVYGGVASQIGGPYVQVTSILNNPQQDPHFFTSSPAIGKSVTHADIIIYNGLGYDPWIEKMIAATESKNKHILVAGNLAGKKLGDNPHIWYDPKTMLIVAEQLTALFQQIDPVHQAFYQQQFSAFKTNYQQLLEKIQQLRQQYQGENVIATEPVFNEMAQALGLNMQGEGFQLSIMNGAEPSVSDVKNFESQLQTRQVKILFYNKQVTSPITERMKNIAKTAGIPILGVTETEPSGQNYFTWMSGQLDDLNKALQSYEHH
jgi:zinc/manganese transport system substrate-binding protein